MYLYALFIYLLILSAFFHLFRCLLIAYSDGFNMKSKIAILCIFLLNRIFLENKNYNVKETESYIKSVATKIIKKNKIYKKNIYFHATIKINDRRNREKRK